MRVLTRPSFVPTPCYRSGVLIVADNDGEILRLDAPAFHRVWAVPCEGYSPSDIVDDVVLAYSFDASELRCFDLASGRLLWAKANVSWVVWRDSILLVGEALELIDARSGHVQSRFELPPHDGWWSVHRDVIVVHSDQRWRAFELPAGTERWPSRWPADVTEALTNRKDGPFRRAYANGSDRVLVIEERKRLVQLQFDLAAATPRVLWRAEFMVPQLRPGIGGDRLWAFHDEHLRCVDLPPDVAEDIVAVHAEFALFRMLGGLRGFSVSDGALRCTYDGRPGHMVPLAEGHYLSLDHNGWLSELSL
jgi:hypothetical protein